MAVNNELLEYQREDAKLRKIEQEIAASEERKRFLQAKKFLESAPEKLEAQDKRAADLKRVAQALTVRYLEIKKEMEEYAAIDKHVDDGGDVSFYKRSAQALSDNLRTLKGEINQLVSDIETVVAEYDKMKKQTIAMQTQYKESKEEYNKVKDSRAKEVDAINTRLREIEKKIPAAVLEKYKQNRKEKIFPIVVPLTNGRCVCGMDFSIAQMSTLSGGNVIECEHCRRFVYKQ
jgi:predicted  nucleic acid-binding Zn-ribbon protein